MEESLKRVILEYLNENRYFTKEGLEEKINEINDEIEEYFKEEVKIYREFFNRNFELTKEELREEMKKELKQEFESYEEDIRKKFKKNIYSVYLLEVLNENYILLEQDINFSKTIFILKGKEAELFTFIFNFYKINYKNNLISREDIEEARILLNIEENVVNKLIEDKVFFGKTTAKVFISKIPFQNREEIYQNLEIEKKIFLKISFLEINKSLKTLKEEIRKAEEKIKESNKKIEEAEEKIKESNEKIEETKEKIKESNEKISNTTKSIENTKVDTLALLAIFVAIISIIYGNIFASNAQSIKNVIITNISTVACIAFILGYIEIFVKDNKAVKRDCFIASSIIIMVLAVIIAILIK